LREAVQADPNSQGALRCLGFILGESGNIQESIDCLKRALKLKPQDYEAAGFLALKYMESGHFEQAIGALKSAIEAKPDHAAFHQNLGQVLLQGGRLAEAEASFLRAIELDPKSSVGAYVSLANLAIDRGEKDRAAWLLHRAYESDPESVNGKMNLGRSRVQSEDFEAAEKAFREVIEIAPKLIPARLFLARALQQLGQFSEAEAVLKDAIAIEPRSAPLYAALTVGRKIVSEDKLLVDRMRVLAAAGGLSPGDDAALHFALGKALEDLGEYEGAMAEFDLANNQMLKSKPPGWKWDPTKYETVYNHLDQVFTRQFFERRRSLGSESDRPVFIVGMIRSGSTLLEQTLSSHPDVGAAGELSFWNEVRATLLDASGRAVMEQNLKSAQDSFLDLLQRKAPKSLRVTDKMNTDYLNLAFIHLAFPKAKIIHCTRDPLDTALSIYTTAVTDGFACKRERIIYVYRQYEKLMKLYQDRFPAGTMLEVRYEDLVQNQEETARNVLGFLGLEWNEACLHPERNKRSVSTPTLWQARQPVYGTSVNRSDHYERWLGALAQLRNG
jgi:tetratricopeptide (TPR) repeat protein